MQNRQSFSFSDNQCTKFLPIMLMLLATYYAGPKLCWHNRRRPTSATSLHSPSPNKTDQPTCANTTAVCCCCLLLLYWGMVHAGPPTGGGQLGHFAPGPSLKGAPGGPMKGPLNTCLKDRYTLIEQSDLNTLIEQSQYSSEE